VPLQAVRTSQSVLAKEKAAIVNDFAPDKKVRGRQGQAALCVDPGGTIRECQGVSSKQWELGSSGIASGVCSSTGVHWGVGCNNVWVWG
jgi:hypothetical protein